MVYNMGMDQYLLIPFLVGWTSIYQLFWCSPGVQGFDTLPYIELYIPNMIFTIQQNRLRIAPAHQLHVKGRGAAEGTADPQTAKLVVTAFLGDFFGSGKDGEEMLV